MVESVQGLLNLDLSGGVRVGNNPACPALGETIDPTGLPYDILTQWKALKIVRDLMEYNPAIPVAKTPDYPDLIGEVRTFSDLQGVVVSECSVGGAKGLEAVFSLKARLADALQPQLQKTPPGSNFSAIEIAMKWASEPTLREAPVQAADRKEAGLPHGELSRRPKSVEFIQDCVKGLYPSERLRGRIDPALNDVQDVGQVGPALETAFGLKAARTITERARQKASEGLVTNKEDLVAKRVLKWTKEEMQRIEEAERLAEQKKRLEELKAKQWSRTTKSGEPRGPGRAAKKGKKGRSISS